MRKFITIWFLSLCCVVSVLADGSIYASSSLLASGKWVKVRVAETGVYKLTYAALKQMGFSDPSKVSVHGYGGQMLSENFSTTYIDDLPSTAVFRGSDYLLFYGRGPVTWNYTASTGLFSHVNNPYSSYGYYFLTDSTETRDVPTVAQTEGASLAINTYDDYVLHEKELASPNASGRELYGESFASTLTQNITDLPALTGITTDDAKVTMRFIARAASSSYTTLSIDGSQLVAVTFPSTSYTYTKAVVRESTGTWSGTKSESPKITISYSSSGDENVRLDYLRVQYKRALQSYGAVTFFRSIASINNASRFTIANADANTIVLDVTDPLDVKQMTTTLNGTDLSFTIPAGSLREFALVKTNGTISAPETVGTVEAQNLHGLKQYDMVILSPSKFVTEAERLAAAHRTHDSLSVVVVTPEQIYNEFSSGTPDATAIRRFMKMFYDRKTSDSDAPKYLLLFGDGVYDNRGLTDDVKSLPLSNMLLTFQSQNSLTAESYVSDDYFGFLDDNSGQSLITDKLRIGVGRFPISSLTAATQTVDKVISYMNNTNTGAWKNNLAFVADDGSTLDDYSTEHLLQADQVADYIETNHPEFLVNKVYFDAYKKDKGGSSSYPDVNTKIQKLLKNGLLMINYTGHGNTTSWADEHVLTQTDIENATYSCLPLWITATCDFTRFDDVATSAGESVFLNKTSGGIGLFTTVRVAYSSTNFTINKQLVNEMFVKNNGRRLTLGEVMKETKCALIDSYGSSSDLQLNKLNFILIGDPALKLAYPEYTMNVTSINGEAVSTAAIKLKALEKVTVAGEVKDADGKLASTFNGALAATVLDSRDTVTTLGNNAAAVSYKDFTNTLYVGNDSVRAGQFSFTFTVPKDISYSNTYGKMNLYAADATSGNEAQGSYGNYIVGGSSASAATDTVGPAIRKLFLNDSTFVSGGDVNTTPLFYARLWDESGVNITGSSIGHDMMLTIDNSTTLSYNLNSYYTTSGDEGIVSFSIPALSTGLHTATFKVWDVLNNSSDTTFTFNVKSSLKPFFYQIVASPSPARTSVDFRIYHNRPETAMKVRVQVFSMTGQLLWQKEENGSSELFKAYVVTWNLFTNGGTRVPPGIYIYRAAISCDGSTEVTKANKLIVLAQ